MGFFLFTLACLLVSFLFCLCLGSHIGETLWVWFLMILSDPISQKTPGPLAPPQRFQIESFKYSFLLLLFIYVKWIVICLFCEMFCMANLAHFSVLKKNVPC